MPSAMMAIVRICSNVKIPIGTPKHHQAKRLQDREGKELLAGQDQLLPLV